ncbi:MAG: hypothetical protein IKA09_05490 [Lachnospiraceae bacterium]|nr:hypothetical protein [Lachnospiraceae bacterium]
MESELLWRQEEINFFKNQLNNFIADEDKNRYRKALVLILYSHLEGFMKVSLLTYVQYLNSLGLKNNQVKSELKASSINIAFQNYENKEIHMREIKDKNKKIDSELNKFYRRVQLILEIDPLNESNLNIDDTVINTESNLWYEVLQKNLYRIGLPIDLFNEMKKNINALVHRRNGIAHGDKDSGVKENEFDIWLKNTNIVLNDTIKILYEYAINKKYLKETI